MSEKIAELSSQGNVDHGKEDKVGSSNAPDNGYNAEKDAQGSVLAGPQDVKPPEDTQQPPSSSPENGEERANQEDTPRNQKLSRSKNVIITMALCLSTFLAALDMTIITTALPTISKDFHASQAGYTWIGSAYLLASAAVTPSWGKVSDIFGRKPMLMAANVVFLVGSLLCAVSVNTGMLIGSRAVQGLGGGGLLVLVNICISDLFSIRSRSMYFAILGVVWGVAGAVGPLVGGLLTQLITWRWCFYINLPLDGIALVITFFFLEIHTPKTPLLAGIRAIDWLGSLAVIGGTVMLLIGIEYGGVSYPWTSATVVCLIVFGVFALGIFVIFEWKVSRYPIMPLRLFKRRSAVAAYISGFTHIFIYVAGSYYLPLYFQIVLEATPLMSGVYLLPHVLSIMVAQLVSGWWAKKSGECVTSAWVGSVITLLSQGLYITFPSRMSWARLIAFQIVAGIGLGPNFQALVVSLHSHTRLNDVASATSTFYFLRNIANSVSVVVGGVIFNNKSREDLNRIKAILSPETVAALEGASAGATTDIVRALPPEQKLPVLEAYTAGLRTMWIFYTAIAAVGMLASFSIGRKNLTKEHEITKTGLDVQEQDRNERLQRQKEKKDQKSRTQGV